MWPLLISFYFAILITAIIVGMCKYLILDNSTRIMFFYIFIATAAEITAYYCAKEYKNNLPVYHILSPIQLAVLSFYYSSIISTIKKRVALIISIGGVIIAIFNAVFVQNPFKQLNTYFLVLESIVIIVMTLYFFYYYLNLDYDSSRKLLTHFIISCLLLLFWSFTFLYWLAGLSIRIGLSDNGVWMKFMIMGISIITYTGFGLVFLFYRKLQPR